jgi:hypothetical protein
VVHPLILFLGKRVYDRAADGLWPARPPRLAGTFDDDRAVAEAGLALVATLSERLETRALANELIDLGGLPGHALPGRKALTLVYAIVAIAECVDDCGVPRSGSTGDVLGHDVMAPSTF